MEPALALGLEPLIAERPGAREDLLQRHGRRRVALFFNHRGYTTGLYCRRALESICSVDVFLPRERWRAPSRYDLYLAVDDSSHYPFPPGKPSAFWVSDTHRAYAPDRAMAGSFAMVFATQLEAVRRLRQDGLMAFWLPHAADPEIHGGPVLPKAYDLAFVGQPGGGRRQRLLERLTHAYPNSFFGYAHYTEVSAIYRRARIVFNHSIGGDINMRVFEALASGSLLLTDELPAGGLDQVLKPGKHLLLYRDEGELVALIDRYLRDEQEREAIARRGREEFLRAHSYWHRMAALLDRFFDSSAPAKGWPDFARAGAALWNCRLSRALLRP